MAAAAGVAVASADAAAGIARSFIESAGVMFATGLPPPPRPPGQPCALCTNDLAPAAYAADACCLRTALWVNPALPRSCALLTQSAGLD